MANPIIDYDVTIIHTGANLQVTGEGTPNITASYDDVTASSVLLAHCSLNIQYTNVQWTINNDNSVTVTGNITSATLVRNGTGASSTLSYNIWTQFNGSTTFSTTVVGSSSGTYNLNFPASFSITVPPQTTSTASSIHFFSQWTGGTYDPDEFTVGLIVTNPNLPDYRPGKVMDNNSTWQSHNRTNGRAYIRNQSAQVEMRTLDGAVGTGNPPTIRHNAEFKNMRKSGAE